MATATVIGQGQGHMQLCNTHTPQEHFSHGSSNRPLACMFSTVTFMNEAHPFTVFYFIMHNMCVCVVGGHYFLRVHSHLPFIRHELLPELFAK